MTDRQTNSLTPYTGVCVFFLSVKFVTSLLASLAGGLFSGLGEMSQVFKVTLGNVTQNIKNPLLKKQSHTTIYKYESLPV